MKTHLIKSKSKTHCGRVLAPHWGIQLTTDKELTTCRVCRALVFDKEFDDVFRGFSYNQAIKQIAKPKS
jgi:hypothetical protein